ncbi:epoxide hydrolase family protein [Sphingomonas profundi]|uniref:epoxide hydrolase family protein n=1 Tax=Alterirhizorhabdus profundi TaxID=2681549 RepID=UPI0012E798F5|nr:epoxide hydrolase family protein [Sphingomonas profundi]
MITPFKIAVPQADLDDLRTRLRSTRWPDRETVGDESQGVRLAAMQSLIDRWAGGYDWRACEAWLNANGNSKATIHGLEIQFLHVRSPVAGATPLLLTHGWPGSILEFRHVVGPLSDPEAFGGKAEDAFHLVIPSLPGFGYSERPSAAGCDLPEIARIWADLMQGLGYDRWFAQGGDLGAGVATHMAVQGVKGLAGIHLNLPILFPPPIGDGEPEEAELSAISDLIHYQKELSGYSLQQSTRPQTLGYSLSDSPVGQAAWIYEKLIEWSDGVPFPLDEMIDNVMLYWLTGTATSASRLYWESFRKDFHWMPVELQTAVSIFHGDFFKPPRIWGERTYSNLVSWAEQPKGGHFAAWEQPQAFVDEIRRAFRLMR